MLILLLLMFIIWVCIQNKKLKVRIVGSVRNNFYRRQKLYLENEAYGHDKCHMHGITIKTWENEVYRTLATEASWRLSLLSAD